MLSISAFAKGGVQLRNRGNGGSAVTGSKRARVARAGIVDKARDGGYANQHVERRVLPQPRVPAKDAGGERAPSGRDAPPAARDAGAGASPKAVRNAAWKGVRRVHVVMSDAEKALLW